MKRHIQTSTKKSRNRPLLTTLFAACITASLSASAQAGGRLSQDQGSGFFLFDIFASASNSKYRRPSPQVRGYNRKVGGYSYKFEDTLNGYGSRPNDLNPIFDGHLFSPRLGTDGPYIGD